MKIGFWKMEEIKIDEIMYVDDMATLANAEKSLQHELNVLH